MTNKDFLEALSKIYNDPVFDNKFKNNRRKRKKSAIRAVVFIAVALILTIGTILLAIGISTKRSNTNSLNNNGGVLINIDPDNVTPSDKPVVTDISDSQHTPEQNSNHTAYAIGQYLTFEELIKTADVLLKGKCVEYLEEPDHQEYVFEVLQVYRGNVKLSRINVYVPYYDVSVQGGHNVNYRTDDTSYRPGDSYILALLDRCTIYVSNNRYLNVGGNLFIPASNIGLSSIYGESLLKHSKLNTIPNENDFLEYICTLFDTKPDSESTDKKIQYIESTDINTVIEKSDYILQVKIADEKYIRSTSNRNTYECIAMDVIFGNINNGEIVIITFPKDLVKSGDEIIVALFESGNTLPRSFVLSSEASVFSLNQKNDIVAILNQ